MPNRPPGPISLTDQNLLSRAEGGYAATFTSTDPEGRAVYFSTPDPRFVFMQSSDPFSPGAVLSLAPGYEFGPNAPATVNVRVLATDEEGATRKATFTLDITPSGLVSVASETEEAPDGTNGAYGTMGALGTETVPPTPGGDGGAGGPGTDTGTISVYSRAKVGSGFGDDIGAGQEARGGSGGYGGSGGSAVSPGVAPEGPAGTYTFWAGADAGDGGDGGDGGSAAAALGGLRALLEGGGAASDMVGVSARSVSGQGGAGGDGGFGGGFGTFSGTHAEGGVTATYLGGARGAGGDGGDGGDSGAATAVIGFVTIKAGALGGQISATASASSGGNGGDGGSGDAGGVSGHGGDGGDAGDAAAGVTGLRVKAGLGMSLSVSAWSDAGAGGWGGSGGDAAAHLALSGDALTTTYGTGGVGGDGGDGGDAVTSLSDVAITGSAAADSVSLQAYAFGGSAGRGGSGGWEGDDTPGTVTLDLPGFGTRDVQNHVVAGMAGADGTDGSTGQAVIELSDIQVALGDGDDRLRFVLQSYDGDETNGTIAATNVSLDGGSGWDILDLTGLDRAAVVDLRTNTLTVGDAAIGIKGFEEFYDDGHGMRFVDRGGAQTYHVTIGNGSYLVGSDVAFTRGNGADVVDLTWAQAGDPTVQGDWTLHFSRYGAAMNSLAEFRAAATQHGEDVVVHLNATDSVTLRGATMADLTADHILFG